MHVFSMLMYVLRYVHMWMGDYIVKSSDKLERAYRIACHNLKLLSGCNNTYMYIQRYRGEQARKLVFS